jgi:hypothetical protein
MEKAEAQKIARALQRRNLPASSYDSGSNFGYGVLNYETNALYLNPWTMPEAWLAVYRRMLATEARKADQTKGNRS